MADSPAKRRKTSPTTSIAIDAPPTTPSRIAVPRRDGGRTTPSRPSFASPTKASLSRHNPQLLKQPTPSAATETRPPGSNGKGRNLDDLFARALGEVLPVNDGPSVITGEQREGTKSLSTTQENEPQDIRPRTATSRPATPKAGGFRAVGGGLSTKPRRRSQSPAKKPAIAPIAAAEQLFGEALPQDFNPFKKKGLRRSPVSSQAEVPVPSQEEEVDNPFRKKGLRRSPVTSSQVDIQPPSHEDENPFLNRGLRKSPVPSQLDFRPLTEEHENPFQKRGLRKSPIAQQVDARPPTREDGDPFQRKGLKKSPVPSQVDAESPQINDDLFEDTSLRASLTLPEVETHISPKENIDIDPFAKTGLERSPIAVQQQEHLAPFKPKLTEPKPQPAVSTTPTEPLPSHALLVEVVSRPKQDETSPPRSAQQPLFSKVAAILQGRKPPPEEPELPPTPTQLGIPDPVVTTPPSGIHDTPSRRHRKKLKSSPLKPRDPPPASPRKASKSAIKQKPSSENPIKRRKSARFFIPKDPHASKKKERDDLLKELQQLQADVSLANQENERLRLRAESKRSKSAPAPNPEDLLAMLLRSTAPETAPEPKPKPTSIFKNIGAFLPFRPRRKPATAPISEKPLPSHLPIHLEDPLPYLQAFSPLTYTSTITLLQPAPTSPDTSIQDPEEPPLLQRHVIHASHASGLFASRFSMTVDTSSLTISSLDILRVDMPAERELGTFIRSRARSEGPLGQDVSAICWAMGRWAEVSIERARFWCNVEGQFGTVEARHKSLQKRRKRKRPGTSAVDDEEVEDDMEGDGEGKTKWNRRQLLAQMGRTALELSSKEVELRFEWKIGFDWTGEVESSLSASARVPRNWQEKDDRKSLSRVPETFNKMVKERGPLGAVRAMVGLFLSVD